MPTLKFDPLKISAILVAHGGWVTIAVGSLKIDTLEPAAPTMASGQNTYGFYCITTGGTAVTGRLSALLAVEQAGR